VLEDGSQEAERTELNASGTLAKYQMNKDRNRDRHERAEESELDKGHKVLVCFVFTL
jgi:hypothetical protein